MVIIYVDHIWCSYIYGEHIWWSCTVIIFDDHTWRRICPSPSYPEFYYHLRWSCIWWSSYMTMLYDDHVWWSYMMIMYDDHLWWSYMMILWWYIYMVIIYDEHVRWSYVMIIYEDHKYMVNIYDDYETNRFLSARRNCWRSYIDKTEL
jgi:hypothetical protein